MKNIIKFIFIVAFSLIVFLFVAVNVDKCFLKFSEFVYSKFFYKEENYYKEENLTEFADNRDGYLYKINDELFISVSYDENFEVKKANKNYNSNYSDLKIYSDTMFEGKDPLNSYYLIKDEKLYIKNDELKKCIDLGTSQINDFGNEIDGDWDSLQ